MKKASENACPAELRLRPHHLLCLQTFVGHGYSDEFVARMTLVHKQLKADPHTCIMLVNGADDLCAHCPNCVKGKCTSENPAEFDRLVSLKLADSDEKSPSPETDETQSVKNPLQGPLILLKGIPETLHITENLISECCPECEWKELCISVCRSRA